MSKKAIKIFTATAVAATVVAPVASASTTFKDVSASNSHFEAIQSLAERGVINGFEDGTYRPNATLTRGQAAKILAEVLNLDTSSTSVQFKDVSSNSIYIGAINALANEGIINGFEDSTFRQNDPLTRGQMAKILVNAFKFEKSEKLSHSFKDVSASNIYKNDIQTLLDHEITQGTTATTFGPTEAVTRGQMATFVVRAEKALQEISLLVTSVSGTTLHTEDGSFEFDTSLKSILAEINNEVLANAVVKATVKDNKIVAISTLQINASGTAEKSLVLDGQADTFNGSISVVGDFVEIKNVKITKDIYVGGAIQKAVHLNGVEVEGSFNIVEEPSKVASLTPVANTEASAKYTFENSKAGSINISRNLATVTLDENSSAQKVTIANNVTELNLNGKFSEVTLPTAGEIKLTGNATIEKILAGEANTIIDIIGSIATLELTNPNAKITLNPDLKIESLVLPEGVDAATVISNYDEVRANIAEITNTTGGATTTTENVPGGEVVVTPSNPNTPTPDEKDDQEQPELPQLPEQPIDPGTEQLPGEKPVTPIGEDVKITISSILTTPDSATTTTDTSTTTDDTSTITTSDTVFVRSSDNEIYKIASNLAAFLRSNGDALRGAQITVVVNNGRIEAIKDLELVETPATLLDGGGITIYGNLKVSNNIEKLMNITVTGNVSLAADRTENIDIISSKVYGKVEFETVKALAMRSMFAGIAPFAAATTRIKITFTDSTVAIIEVRKNDVELHTGGTTEVANIRLFANTDITSELTNGKILPKIVIGQGVTNVKLNASIANVIIESDENVIVGGEGNFENVVVNTSKEVALNTVGTIGNLDIKKADPKVTLGKEVEAVKQVTTILPVEEVFQNFDELKGKVGQVVLPDVEFFAAELIQHFDKFGEFTIKLAGFGKNTVKYSLVDYDGYWKQPEIVRNQDKAPADAVTYNVGERLFIPANKALIVYMVDSSNIIKDYKNDFRYGTSIQFTATETGTKIESTFDVEEGSKVSDVYNGIFSFELGKPVIYLGATTIDAYTWTKEGNVVSFVVPGTDKFTLAEEDEQQKYFEFNWNDRKVAGQGYGGSFGGEKATALKVIKEIYSRSVNDPAPADMLTGPINLAFYAELNIKENIVDYSNGEQYRSAVESAKTLEELYDLILIINSNKK